MASTKTFPQVGASIDIVENLSALEVYVTEATALGIAGPNVTVTFTSLRWDNSTQPAVLKRVVVARLVMPIAAAQNLTLTLHDHLAQNGHPVQRPLPSAQLQ